MSSSVIGSRTVAHIGMVVPDVEAAARGYAELLGIELPEIRDGANRPRQYLGEPLPDGVGLKVARFRLENIEIELVEPVGGPSTWHDMLAERGPGVHHIAFEVQDSGQTIADLEARGYPAIHTSIRANGTPLAYVDARNELGALMEILGL